MRLLLQVPDDVAHAYRGLLGRRHTLIEPRNLPESLEAIMNRRVDAIVMDPMLFRPDAFAKVLAAVGQSGLPVVLSAEPVPFMTERILLAAQRGILEIVLRGVEDDGFLLAQFLEQLPTASVPALMFHRLADRIATLPFPVAHATLELFCRGRDIPGSAETFVSRTNVGRRTMTRALSANGLAGPARLLDVARAAHAWRGMVSDGAGEAAAVTAGYSSARTMGDHFRKLVRLTPGQARRTLTADQFASRLEEAVLLNACPMAVGARLGVA